MKRSNHNVKQVWDIAIRLFHWSLVVAFMVAYISGDDESAIHIYSGYFILGLVVFRVVWGFIGSKHAQFKDFIFSPREVISYTKGMFSGTAKHYRGHNPLGGLMVMALLLTLFMTTVSGLKVYGIEGHGPLAVSDTSYFISSANASGHVEHDSEGEDSDEEEFWEEIHEFFANLMLLLIAAHIIGVLVSSKLHDENLIKAMITGYKEH